MIYLTRINNILSFPLNKLYTYPLSDSCMTLALKSLASFSSLYHFFKEERKRYDYNKLHCIPLRELCFFMKRSLYVKQKLLPVQYI